MDNQKPVKKKKTLPKWARVILKIGRAILVPTLCLIALIAGMSIGYVKIGGGEFAEVFEVNTWRHLFDLVFKD